MNADERRSVCICRTRTVQLFFGQPILPLSRDILPPSRARRKGADLLQSLDGSGRAAEAAKLRPAIRIGFTLAGGVRDMPVGVRSDAISPRTMREQ